MTGLNAEMDLATPLLFLEASMMLIAAGLDLRSRVIPNKLVLAIVVVAIGIVLASRAPGQSVINAMQPAAIVFGGGIAVYLTGILGAADVKLLAAVTLFAGPLYWIQFLSMTGFAGGLLAAFYLVRASRLKIDTKSISVPYGVAICAGSLWMIGLQLRALS